MFRVRPFVATVVVAILFAAATPVNAEFTNSDFDTPASWDSSNYLWGWSTYWTGYPDTDRSFVQLEESDGNRWVHLHAEGQWLYDDFFQMWSYGGERAEIEQLVFIPADATEITLDYIASITDNTGDGAARPVIEFGYGFDDVELAPAADWTTVSVPIPPACRGQRLYVAFKVKDEWVVADGSEDMGSAPGNIVDFHIDNISTNGAQAFESVDWDQADGGAWFDPANWDGAAPDNTAATAYSVWLAHPTWATPLGPTPVTVSSDVEVQELTIRYVDQFRIDAGRTVRSRDDLGILDTDVVMEAGSSLIAGNDFTSWTSSFSGGSLTTLPGAGETSLIQIACPSIFGWELDGDWETHTGGPVMDLTDALVRVTGTGPSFPGDFAVFDSAEVTFTRSAACTEPVGVECNRILIQHLSTVTLNEGTGVYGGAEVAVANGTLNVLGGELGGPAEADQIDFLSNAGVVNIVGDLDVWAAHPYYAFNGRGDSRYGREAELNLNGGVVRFNGDFHNGAESIVNLTGAVLDVGDAEIELGSGSAFYADADSTVICGRFINVMADASRFDMSEATLELVDCGDSLAWLRSQGVDVGPLLAGYDNNFAIGELRVLGQTKLSSSVGNPALYVKDLHIADGSVLDLSRGFAVYYNGSFTGGGAVTGGRVLYAPSAFIGVGGDANGDFKVDLDDFVALKINFGSGPDAAWAQGDFDGNGRVDLDDFVILKDNFGQRWDPATQMPDLDHDGDIDDADIDIARTVYGSYIPDPVWP